MVCISGMVGGKQETKEPKFSWNCWNWKKNGCRISALVWQRLIVDELNDRQIRQRCRNESVCVAMHFRLFFFFRKKKSSKQKLNMCINIIFLKLFCCFVWLRFMLANSVYLHSFLHRLNNHLFLFISSSFFSFIFHASYLYTFIHLRNQLTFRMHAHL